MTRTDAREVLMQAVFQMEIQKNTDTELFEQFLNSKTVSADQEGYIKTSFELIVNHLDDIDELINKFSKGWKTNRLPKVDLAILRVGIGELLYVEETPAPVAINEAVKLAKRFSEEKS